MWPLRWSCPWWFLWYSPWYFLWYSPCCCLCLSQSMSRKTGNNSRYSRRSTRRFDTGDQECSRQSCRTNTPATQRCSHSKVRRRHCLGCPFRSCCRYRYCQLEIRCRQFRRPLHRLCSSSQPQVQPPPKRRATIIGWQQATNFYSYRAKYLKYDLNTLTFSLRSKRAPQTRWTSNGWASHFEVAERTRQRNRYRDLAG